MNKHQQDRIIKHRLAVLCHPLEVSGSVAKTCRYFGISRTVFYKWKRRYEELGPQGLLDRSRGPHHVPTATPQEVVGKIIYLRQNYHFGPMKISMYMKREPPRV